jgi:hypothetical protein
MDRWTTQSSFVDQLTVALQSGGNPLDPTVQSIVDWLANLRLLNGVPFQYIVPDDRMLPPESIRFFYVDQNWIDCLIDGAFSIGRSVVGDGPITLEVSKRSDQAARTLRAKRHGLAVSPAQDDPEGFAKSGFLLRSAVVTGWPGMEVKGYADYGLTQPVDIARFEYVASDILLCLFASDVLAITFSEAAEILHFGLDLAGGVGGPYKKELKYVDQSGSHLPGSMIPGVFVDVPLLDDRVVDVEKLAGQIHDSLLSHGGINPSSPYTPAEFALELILGVQQVDFTFSGGAN